ncbi:MAG: hypothetical protein LBH14_03140 [Desulfobulbaceae bacterium]|nr:hypothetical protein [Desulfobulbaceae bacterium]
MPIAGEAISEVLARAATVLVASGKKIIELSADTTQREDILPLVTGRSGTLRAPTLLVGDTLYVGFSDELYRRLAAGKR